MTTELIVKTVAEEMRIEKDLFAKFIVSRFPNENDYEYVKE